MQFKIFFFILVLLGGKFAFADDSTQYNELYNIKQQPNEVNNVHRLFTEKHTSLTLNINYSQINYDMKTAADSILKYRDAAGFGGEFEIATDITKKSRMYFNYNFANFKNGTMSDYDMENSFPSGIFSESLSMNGFSQGLGGAFGWRLIDNTKETLIGVLGYEYRTVTFQPRNVYQVGNEARYTTSSSGRGNGYTYYFSGDTQKSVNIMRILQIGGDYSYMQSSVSKFNTKILLLVPLYYDSKQYQWGYGNTNFDWRLTKKYKFDYLNNLGVNFKIGNQFKVGNGVWLNIFTFGDFIKLSQANEYNNKLGTVEYGGKTQYTKLYKLGVGTGFTFQ